MLARAKAVGDGDAADNVGHRVEQRPKAGASPLLGGRQRSPETGDTGTGAVAKRTP